MSVLPFKYTWTVRSWRFMQNRSFFVQSLLIRRHILHFQQQIMLTSNHLSLCWYTDDGLTKVSHTVVCQFYTVMFFELSRSFTQQWLLKIMILLRSSIIDCVKATSYISVVKANKFRLGYWKMIHCVKKLILIVFSGSLVAEPINYAMLKSIIMTRRGKGSPKGSAWRGIALVLVTKIGILGKIGSGIRNFWKLRDAGFTRLTYRCDTGQEWKKNRYERCSIFTERVESKQLKRNTGIRIALLGALEEEWVLVIQVIQRNTFLNNMVAECFHKNIHNVSMNSMIMDNTLKLKPFGFVLIYCVPRFWLCRFIQRDIA